MVSILLKMKSVENWGFNLKFFFLNIFYKMISVRFNYGFKNRTGSAGLTANRSRFRSDLVNWLEKWLNRNQICWTSGPINEPIGSHRTRRFNYYYYYFTVSKQLFNASPLWPTTSLGAVHCRRHGVVIGRMSLPLQNPVDPPPSPRRHWL